MIDKGSLLKSQGSLYLEFIPNDGLFTTKCYYCRLWDFKLVDVTYTSFAALLLPSSEDYLEPAQWLKANQRYYTD